MVYMFNELSITPVNSTSEARNILEIFIKSSRKAKELGFNEIRLHENSLQNLFQLKLSEEYRIDHWLNDRQVSSDLQDSFREILTTSPLITNEEISENELYERSEFHKLIDGKIHRIYGLGAAFIYGTLATSLATHEEWSKSNILIEHYSLNHEGVESKINVQTYNFSSIDILLAHKKWIEDEQLKSLEKSIDLWNNKEQYFPNLLFGLNLKDQIEKIGLTKRFDQVFDCLKKLDEFAEGWKEGGFELKNLKNQSKLNVSGESDTTMQKYSVERKFKLSNGEKVQFELHIKIPDVRIYFWPDEKEHEITIGYIGKHLRTALFS